MAKKYALTTGVGIKIGAGTVVPIHWLPGQLRLPKIHEPNPIYAANLRNPQRINKGKVTFPFSVGFIPTEDTILGLVNKSAALLDTFELHVGTTKFTGCKAGSLTLKLGTFAELQATLDGHALDFDTTTDPGVPADFHPFSCEGMVVTGLGADMEMEDATITIGNDLSPRHAMGGTATKKRIPRCIGEGNQTQHQLQLNLLELTTGLADISAEALAAITSVTIALTDDTTPAARTLTITLGGVMASDESEEEKEKLIQPGYQFEFASYAAAIA